VKLRWQVPGKNRQLHGHVNYISNVRLANEQETDFVLPDLAFLELIKNDMWKETLRGSLAILAEAPNRVHVAYSVNEALKHELDTLHPLPFRKGCP
jgi:hypothetical protein